MQARAQGTAYCAQTADARRRVDFSKNTSEQVLAMADSMPLSFSAGLTPNYRTGLDAENFLVNEEPYDAAAGPLSFPAEGSSFHDKDSLFYGGRRPAYKDPRLPRLRGASPGPTTRDGQREMKAPSPKSICYTCYKVGDHVNPDCSMKVRDLSLVPLNFEKLTAAQKSRVPADAYLRAVALLSFEANRLTAPVVPSKSPSTSEKPTQPDDQAASPKNWATDENR